MAMAQSYVLDAATYAEAWATSDDPEQKRSMALALSGLVLEAQDVARYVTGMLHDDEPGTFGEYAASSFDFYMGNDEVGGLLQWAIFEVIDRAEQAPACSGLLPKLTALAEDARELGVDYEQYDDEGQLTKLHNKARKLARKVHLCAGDEARADTLGDRFRDTW